MKVNQSIRPGMQNDKTKMEGWKVMLTIHSLVDGHKDVVVGLGEFQQRSIFIASPTGFRDRLDSVPGEPVLQASGKALI